MSGILDSIKKAHFLSLTKDNKLVAVLTLMENSNRLAGKDYPAVYSYGFAVEASERRKGYGTLLANQALQYGLSKLGETGIDYCFV